MSAVTKFEELTCWKKSRELVLLVYQESSKGPLAKDFATKDQIRRASISVMNNIAEGFARYSRKEFARFLDFSQSSCVEVKSMTYMMEDLDYLPVEKLKEIRTKAEDIISLTRALITTLKH